MRAAGGATPGDAALEVEDIQDHREDAVDDDDEHDGGDYSRCGREPDRRGAPPRLHAPEAADERDENTEHHALADADEEVGQAHRAASLLEILGGAAPYFAYSDAGAPENSEQVRVDREQRHHQDQGQHPGKDEELHR